MFSLLEFLSYFKKAPILWLPFEYFFRPISWTHLWPKFNKNSVKLWFQANNPKTPTNEIFFTNWVHSFVFQNEEYHFFLLIARNPRGFFDFMAAEGAGVLLKSWWRAWYSSLVWAAFCKIFFRSSWKQKNTNRSLITLYNIQYHNFFKRASHCQRIK